MNPTSNKDHEDEVRDLFSETSDDYAALFRDEPRGVNYCFRKRLALSQEMTRGIGGRLLDAACGPGQITAAIMEGGAFRAATLVDISPEMLARARAHFSRKVEASNQPSLSFVQSSIFDVLQTSIDRFDLVLLLGLIAHTGRLDALLGGLRRRLSDHGVILLQSTLADHPGTKIIRAATRERHYRKFGYHSNYFTQLEIRDACERQGLEIVDTRRFSLGLPWGDKIWARGNHCLEKLAAPWSARFGSEGLFLIRPKAAHAPAGETDENRTTE